MSPGFVLGRMSPCDVPKTVRLGCHAPCGLVTCRFDHPEGRARLVSRCHLVFQNLSIVGKSMGEGEILGKISAEKERCTAGVLSSPVKL
jgi:hypothetical protein